MVSHHEIASHFVIPVFWVFILPFEFPYSQSSFRTPILWYLDFLCRFLEFVFSGFLVRISRICASPIFVISIDKFYQFLCIGEFMCYWLVMNTSLGYDIPFYLWEDSCDIFDEWKFIWYYISMPVTLMRFWRVNFSNRQFWNGFTSGSPAMLILLSVFTVFWEVQLPYQS